MSGIEFRRINEPSDQYGRLRYLKDVFYDLIGFPWIHVTIIQCRISVEVRNSIFTI
jgi:hypothetical protein